MPLGAEKSLAVDSAPAMVMVLMRKWLVSCGESRLLDVFAQPGSAEKEAAAVELDSESR
jgi:hypothetical protein